MGSSGEVVPTTKGDVLLQQRKAKLAFVRFFARLDSVHMNSHDVFGQDLEMESPLFKTWLILC